ncbi:MAG: glycerol acyltransferase [Bacteroidetes bacterium]|nr:glycerol acyltransferase [Bacteroidota bacterium]
MQHISKLILKIFGWRIIGLMPADVKKCVVIVAPHTSYWDFVWGRLAYWAMGVKVKFLIKQEVFVFPFGGLLKRMGGIPVNRRNSANMVEVISRMFKKNQSLYITITPEGTRKKVAHWKKGFYYIALKAGVPIALGILDYRTKEGGIGKIFSPSGNLEQDFKMIEEFYRGRTGKHPEKFNLN